MEPSEQTEEMPSNAHGAPQEVRTPDEAGEEPGGSASPAEAASVPPAPPASLPQAEPGVYLCVAEIAGEHAVLGVLEEGKEYTYSGNDPRELQAVAAYVELGVLEKM